MMRDKRGSLMQIYLVALAVFIHLFITGAPDDMIIYAQEIKAPATKNNQDTSSTKTDLAARITTIYGKVNISKAGAIESTPAKLGEELFPGDVINTEIASRTEITFIDKSVITLGPKSRIGIDEYLFNEGKRRSSTLRILGGKILFKIEKLLFPGVGSYYNLKTSSTVAGIRGTQGVLLTEPTESVYVEEGSVNFSNEAGSATVESGEVGEISTKGERPTKRKYSEEELKKQKADVVSDSQNSEASKKEKTATTSGDKKDTSTQEISDAELKAKKAEEEALKAKKLAEQKAAAAKKAEETAAKNKGTKYAAAAAMAAANAKRDAEAARIAAEKAYQEFAAAKKNLEKTKKPKEAASDKGQGSTPSTTDTSPNDKEKKDTPTNAGDKKDTSTQETSDAELKVKKAEEEALKAKQLAEQKAAAAKKAAETAAQNKDKKKAAAAAMAAANAKRDAEAARIAAEKAYQELAAAKKNLEETRKPKEAASDKGQDSTPSTTDTPPKDKEKTDATAGDKKDASTQEVSDAELKVKKAEEEALKAKQLAEQKAATAKKAAETAAQNKDKKKAAAAAMAAANAKRDAEAARIAAEKAYQELAATKKNLEETKKSKGTTPPNKERDKGETVDKTVSTADTNVTSKEIETSASDLTQEADSTSPKKKGGVSGSSHDMTLTQGEGEKTDPCSFCHIPHGSSVTVPVWNEGNPDYVYYIYTSSKKINPRTGGNGEVTSDSVTKYCLNCHDGVIGPLVHMSRRKIRLLRKEGRLVIRRPNGGQGLIDGHPVNFSYNSIRLLNPDFHDQRDTGLKFFDGVKDGIAANDFLECATCHDPHGAIGEVNFLRKRNSSSNLCFSCHMK